MAARYWVGTTTSWNTSANWSATSGGAGGAGVPTSADDVVFDSGATQNCTCDVAISCLSLNIASTYSGTLDFADSSYSHTIAIDATFGGSGTLDLGNSTITVSGSWDDLNQTTLVYSGGSIVMDGDGETYASQGGWDGRLKSFRASADITVDGGFQIQNVGTGGLIIDTGKTISLTSGIIVVSNSPINSSGTITTSAGTTILIQYGAVITSLGVIDGSGLLAFRYNQSVTIGGNFATDVEFYANSGYVTATLNANTTFYGTVYFKANSTRIVTFQPSNYSIVFRGDIISTIAGTFIWTAGTGTITASGTSNQDWDFNGESVEDIDIDKTSGTLTLSGNVDPDTLTLSSGTLDIDGNNITTINAFTQAFGTTCKDTAGGGLISVGGNLAINGTSVNPCVWNGPDLDVTGTAEASWTTVTNSNASTGSTVDATNNCTDGGGNDSGWNFGSASTGYRKGFLNMQDSQNMGVLLQI